MKTDRELLELAAKATQDSNIRKAGDVFIVAGIGGGVTYWNPLASDGDALRLAVKLFVLDGSSPPVATIDNVEFEVDPYAATRRAIVRAAAAIGETL